MVIDKEGETRQVPTYLPGYLKKAFNNYLTCTCQPRLTGYILTWETPGRWRFMTYQRGSHHPLHHETSSHRKLPGSITWVSLPANKLPFTNSIVRQPDTQGN